jgi:hypothetical protein
MNNNIFKILAPIVGTVFTGTFGYYVGKLQATSTKEIALIKARSAREVALIKARSAREVAEVASNSGLNKIKNELDLIKSKLNTPDSPFDANLPNIIGPPALAVGPGR